MGKEAPAGTGSGRPRGMAWGGGARRTGRVGKLSGGLGFDCFSKLIASSAVVKTSLELHFGICQTFGL